MSVIEIDRRGWFAALRQGIAGWFRRQAQYSALRRLDDRTLADIGLRRSEIGSAVAELNGTAPASRQRIARPFAAANSSTAAPERRNAA